MKLWLTAALALLAVALARPVRSETPPPSASIEERLIRLEEGQRRLDQRLDDMNRRFEDRFQDVNRRLEDMTRRIDDLRADMNQRFGDVMTFLQILVGVLAAMAVGIFGTLLMMWRRLVKVEADVALLSSQFRLVRTP